MGHPFISISTAVFLSIAGDGDRERCFGAAASPPPHFSLLPGRPRSPQKFSVGAAYCTAGAFCAWEIKCPLSSNSLALLRQH